MEANQAEPRDITIKILLTGGHQYSIILKSDAALLRSLLGAFLARTQGKKDSFLFQIPLKKGRSSLCFSSDHLAGIITEPPIVLRQKGDLEEQG